MTKKRAAETADLIKKELSAHTRQGGPLLPVGYNPLSAIRGALLVWAPVPFNGVKVWCQLRCPNATQLEQCGDFSSILLSVQGEEKKELEYDDILAVRNYQENICKLVFNIPKFNEIARIIDRTDFVISEKKNELARLTKEIEENEDNLSYAEKLDLDAQIKELALMTGYILPDDAMAFVTRWAVGADVSQITELTKDQYLRAAALARAHHKAPSDYISGVFTDFNRKEIDTFAYAVFEQFQKDQETVRNSKYHWFLGGRKKPVVIDFPKRG